MPAVSRCTLSRCTLSRCTLSRCTLSRCTLSRCTLSRCTLSRCSQPPIAERRAERGRRSLYSAIGRCDRHCGGGGGEPDRPLGLRVRRNGPPSRGRALESGVFGERCGGDPHDRTF